MASETTRNAGSLELGLNYQDQAGYIRSLRFHYNQVTEINDCAQWCIGLPKKPTMGAMGTPIAAMGDWVCVVRGGSKPCVVEAALTGNPKIGTSPTIYSTPLFYLAVDVCKYSRDMLHQVAY